MIKNRVQLKNRQRVLLLSKDNEAHNVIAMILSSYGYLIDHAYSRREGVRKFLCYHQSIVISDVSFLPKGPKHLERMFMRAQKEPVFLIIAESSANPIAKQYLSSCANEIISSPFDMDDVRRIVQRAVSYNRLLNEKVFYSDILFFLKFLVPLSLMFVIVLMKNL